MASPDQSCAMRILCLIVLSVTLTAEVSARPVAPADVFDIEWASDPRISPDAKQVVYLRNRMDVMRDRRLRELWRVDVDGERHRPVVTDLEGLSQPRWSPSGDRLAFVARADGLSRIFIRWEDSGETAAVTRLRESPTGLSWSPDGRWLAFSMRVVEAPEAPPGMPAKPDGAEWAPAPNRIDRLLYRFDGGGYRDPGFNHLFVVPAGGGTPRQVTRGEFNHFGAPAWTGDGDALIFSANRHADGDYDPQNSELYRVDLNSGVVAALTDRQGPDGSPAVSPDGSRLAYLGYDDEYKSYANRLVYVAAVDGSEPRALTGDLDRSVDSIAWSDDGRKLFFGYDDEGEHVVGSVTLSGDIREEVRGVGGQSLGRPYTSGDFTAARGVIAFTQASDVRPADVAVKRGSRAARGITDLNADVLAHLDVLPSTEIQVRSSHDQRDIDAWTIYPPGFDKNKQYPLVLEIHGGPFSAYGPHFALETQLYAAAGYIVVYANPRGSTSYGAEFANQIHHAYPGRDYDDLMSVVDAVIAAGSVDTSRLFVTGGSGGGVLTAWIVGSTDRFAAAVVQKPVINWTSFVLTADAYNFFYRYWFGALPWEDQAAYWARSPLSKVGYVSTPTMLITGEADYRTPISESEQYYQALKLRRIETAMVRIPEASHGIADRPSHLIAKVAYVLDWFSRHDPARRSD